MDLVILFWIILTLAAVALTFFLIKGVLKAIILAASIIFVVFGILTFFAVMDALDLKDNIISEEKLMVLKEGDTVLAAFSFKNLSDEGPGAINAFNSEELKAISDSVASRDYSSFKKKYYKVFVFEYSSFSQSLSNGLGYSMGKEESSLSNADADEIIRSDKPIEIALKKMDASLTDAEKDEALKNYMSQLGISSQEEFKSFIFALVLADFVKDRGPPELISKIKSKELLVYPNTALFRAIKLMPSFLIDKVSEKFKETAVENA